MSRFPRLRDELEWDAVQQAGPAAVESFEKMIAQGESISMAAQFATCRPPSGGYDEQLVQRNTKSVTEQFKGCGPMLDLYRKNYKAQTGESLPEDAVVYRSLAKYPGDPGCIVTHKQSLSDVKKIMKERNEQVEGDWENHPISEAPQPQVVRMNENVMARYKAEYKMESEEYAKLDERELEEHIIDTHTSLVTADDAMNAPTSEEQVNKATFGGRDAIRGMT
jgi:hypothetical protein